MVRLKYSYYDVLVLYPRTRSRSLARKKTGRTRRRYQQDLFGLKTADEAVPPQSCQCSALQCREHPARRQRPRLCRRRERSFSTARRATTWSSRRRSWRGGCITTTSRDALAGAASPRSGCGNICPRMRLHAVANPSLGAYLCSLARATAPSPSRLMCSNWTRNATLNQRKGPGPLRLRLFTVFGGRPILRPGFRKRRCLWCAPTVTVTVRVRGASGELATPPPPGPVGEARCRARATGLAGR